MGVAMKSVERKRSEAWYYYKPYNMLIKRFVFLAFMQRTYSYTSGTNADD